MNQKDRRLGKLIDARVYGKYSSWVRETGWINCMSDRISISTTSICIDVILHEFLNFTHVRCNIHSSIRESRSFSINTTRSRSSF